MIEFLRHAFVWLASPTIVIAIAVYALLRREFFLGSLAALGAVMLCGLVAMKLFDGHLLVYNLTYGFLLAVPVLLGIVAIVSGARQLLTFSARRVGKNLDQNDVQ